MEPLETDGGLHMASEEHLVGEHAVVATFEQVLTGPRVETPSLKIRCSGCGTHLGEGNWSSNPVRHTSH